MVDNIQKLKNKLASAQGSPDEIDIMLDLAAELRHSDPVQAIYYAQTAGERSLRAEFSNNPYQKADTSLLLGLLNTDLGNYGLALPYLFDALSFFEECKDIRKEAAALDGIGLIYSYLGAYPEALQYYEHELELIEKDGNKKAIADLFSRIGKIEIYWGDSGKALNALHRALQLYEELGDLKGQAEVLDTGCSIYLQIENYGEARYYGEKSADLYRNLGLQKEEAKVLTVIAEVLIALGDYQQALAHLQSSQQAAEKLGLRSETAYGMLQIGEILLHQGNLEQAECQFRSGLQIAEEIGIKQLCARFHSRIAEVLKQTGDHKNALDHFEEFHRLQECIFNQAAEGRLQNMEIAFRAETVRQELEIFQQKTAVLKDEIAERKKVEADLRGVNQQLRQEITEREHLISDLDSFSYMVAHDLKNPLQVVLFGSQVLLDSLKSSIDEDSTDLLQNILQMGEKMRAIIDELLILASVRQQEITLQPLDMGGLIEDAKDRLKHILDEKKVEIILPEKWPTALGHAPWIEEVWTNYISNAIKYGGNPPRIELGATHQGNGYIRFWVRDNGVGLQEEAIGRLFTPFKRLHQVQATGHGLGLSIVKRIIEKLGGNVDVKSDGEGKGSVFSFTLIDATPFAGSYIRPEIPDEVDSLDLD